MTVNINDLLNRTVTSIDGGNIDDDEIVIHLDGGDKIYIYHEQDCCEHVRIVDIDGDIADLVGGPLVELEVVESADGDPAPDESESWTWSFLKIGTTNGFVNIRWLGESNGYYSESVEVTLNERNDWQSDGDCLIDGVIKKLKA